MDSHAVRESLKALVDSKCITASLATKMAEFCISLNHLMPPDSLKICYLNILVSQYVYILLVYSPFSDMGWTSSS